MTTRSPRKRSGFTLIELLVVIAIMGVLAGMLMSGVQKAKEAASRINCTNNMRNIGYAIQMLDADGYFPWEMSSAQPPNNQSFYYQCLNNLELANTLLQADGVTANQQGQAKIFLCSSRRQISAATAGAVDYGYLGTSGGAQNPALATQGMSLTTLTNTSGTSQTALLGHIWMSPATYNTNTPNWFTVGGNYVATKGAIARDTTTSGTGGLGTPHTSMPTLYADNHAGNTPITYPYVQILFSTTRTPGQAFNPPAN